MLDTGVRFAASFLPAGVLLVVGIVLAVRRRRVQPTVARPALVGLGLHLLVALLGTLVVVLAPVVLASGTALSTYTLISGIAGVVLAVLTVLAWSMVLVALFRRLPATEAGNRAPTGRHALLDARGEQVVAEESTNLYPTDPVADPHVSGAPGVPSEGRRGIGVGADAAAGGAGLGAAFGTGAFADTPGSRGGPPLREEPRTEVVPVVGADTDTASEAEDDTAGSSDDTAAEPTDAAPEHDDAAPEHDDATAEPDDVADTTVLRREPVGAVRADTDPHPAGDADTDTDTGRDADTAAGPTDPAATGDGRVDADTAAGPTDPVATDATSTDAVEAAADPDEPREDPDRIPEDEVEDGAAAAGPAAGAEPDPEVEPAPEAAAPQSADPDDLDDPEDPDDAAPDDPRADADRVPEDEVEDEDEPSAVGGSDDVPVAGSEEHTGADAPRTSALGEIEDTDAREEHAPSAPPAPAPPRRSSPRRLSPAAGPFAAARARLAGRARDGTADDGSPRGPGRLDPSADADRNR